MSVVVYRNNRPIGQCCTGGLFSASCLIITWSVARRAQNTAHACQVAPHLPCERVCGCARSQTQRAATHLCAKSRNFHRRQALISASSGQNFPKLVGAEIFFFRVFSRTRRAPRTNSYSACYNKHTSCARAFWRALYESLCVSTSRLVSAYRCAQQNETKSDGLMTTIGAQCNVFCVPLGACSLAVVAQQVNNTSPPTDVLRAQQTSACVKRAAVRLVYIM